MIKFTDMAENAFKLAHLAKEKMPNGVCNSIMDLIEDTYNAGDDIEAVIEAKYNFNNAIRDIDLKDCAFDSNLYNSLTRIANFVNPDNKNIYAYMVCIIRLAEVVNYITNVYDNEPIVIGRITDDGTLQNAAIAYDIMVDDIGEKICYNSGIAQIYYAINNYDAILQYERCSNADYDAIWSSYKRLLVDIYDIIRKNDSGSPCTSDWKIEKDIIDLNDKYSYFKSYKRIDALRTIINTHIIKMVKNMREVRKDATQYGSVAGTAMIMCYINDTILAIDSNIVLSEMNECSYFKWYISDYIDKFINADDTELKHCNEGYRGEFISRIQCIVEDNEYELSEFDTACLNAIMVFNTYAESRNLYSDDNDYTYANAVSELMKLLKANSIDDVNKVTSAIRNLIPSSIISKSISININSASEIEETEKCTANEESDEKNEIADDPSECSEWIEELSTAVSEVKDTVNNILPKNSMEEDAYKETVELINQINHICDSISSKANELIIHEKDASIDRLGYPHEVDEKEELNEPANDAPISWNEYFMELAETAAKRSKDPRSKVGACIMDPRDHRVVSLGYNGFPYGCSDDEFPWSREGDDNKYLYVVHAELNAILSARKDLTGCVLFVTYSPCNECMKAIIQSGIKAVVYKNEYKPESHINIASTKMAKAAGVSIIKYDNLLETEDSFFDIVRNNLLKNFEHEAE